MDELPVPPWPTGTVPDLRHVLDFVLRWERHWSAECDALQQQIDDTVFDAYGIENTDRQTIEQEVGAPFSAPVWPEMAGKSQEEKRLEHVLRLLSYIVKTACEEDDDGIVPLVLCGGEPTLIERARTKLDEFFGEGRSHEIENEINAELQVNIKGNRNCGPRMTMADWFATRYFDYHVKLYKRRPIFWHICTDDGSFGAIVHYHRFDKNRLQKLRAHYLKGHRDRLVQRINELSGDESKKARGEIEKLEGNIRAADELDRKLAMILNGEEYRIEVPWKSEEEQPQGWTPDIDDGVKVNIGPFQSAAVLAAKKVV